MKTQILNKRKYTNAKNFDSNENFTANFFFGASLYFLIGFYPTLEKQVSKVIDNFTLSFFNVSSNKGFATGLAIQPMKEAMS